MQSVGDLLSVASLTSLSLIEKVLVDHELRTTEVHLFNLEKAWSDVTVETEAGEDRKGIASELVAQHINFTRIHPRDIRNTVKPSGPATTETLLKANEHHAMRADIRQEALPKRGLCWDYCDGVSHSVSVSYMASDNTGLLKCREMNSGKHVWSIQVNHEERPDAAVLWLGVACPSSTQTQVFFGG